MSDIEVPNEILYLRDILSLAVKFPETRFGRKSPCRAESSVLGARSDVLRWVSTTRRGRQANLRKDALRPGKSHAGARPSLCRTPGFTMRIIVGLRGFRAGGGKARVPASGSPDLPELCVSRPQIGRGR
jgi:hypothetical protein